jgi:hypothetical protein
LKTSEDEPEKTLTKKRCRSYGTGSVYLDKGSNRWSIQYYQNGHRKRESTGYANKRDAQAWLTKQLNEINNGQSRNPSESGTQCVSKSCTNIWKRIPRSIGPGASRLYARTGGISRPCSARSTSRD